MGFYGNITNTSRTQFQFDKIYPNRKEMEQKILTDGVYLNRYVLIEYDDEYHLDTLLRVQFKDGKAYYNPQGETGFATLVTKKLIGKDELVYTADSLLTPETGLTPTNCIFYKCTSEKSNSNDPATFERAEFSASNYTTNYHIDTTAYGQGRGYDSTVWQKVYTENVEKYVMIAELNTVVPTFDVAADAPTMNPIVPHFDTQSTDVYYKLHWQAPWGFRVKASEDTYSDEQTDWTTYKYNKDDNTHTKEVVSKNADIYFNEAAFAPYGNEQGVVTKHKGRLNEDGSYLNEIKVEPTGSSGNQYNKHDGTTNTDTANDIQEMTIHLPAIGNMMSDAWDIIHGPNRDNARTDENGSLQGRLDSFTEMNVNAIPVKRASDGTLVSSYINGNTNKEVNDVLSEELSESFDSDDAWIKTSINTIGLDNITDLSGIAIHHTFHSTPDTSTIANKNDATGSGENRGQGDTLKLYTPIVDKAGHVVGKNTETVTLPYGFKTIKTNGRSDEITENATGAPETANIVADNTQDELTINSGNKWIRIDTDENNDSITIRHDVHNISSDEKTTDWTQTEADTTVPVVTYNYDEAGHYVSHHTENYKLPFGYGKIKGDSGDTAATATYDELTFTSDEWLTATVSKDKVTYNHDYPKKIDDTTSEYDVNGNGDTIILETLKRDDKGHVIKVNQNTVTLPYGYKTFTGDTGSSSADNTQDTMSITGDSWVQTKVSKDKIEFSHIGPVAVTAVKVDDITPKFGETFDIIDWYYDEKGHKSSNNTHTVKIPLPSLTKGTGNVVTGLTLNAAEGALTETKNNISNLLLTDYSKKTNSEDIAATDALGDALSKLQTQIHNANNNLVNEKSRAEAAEAKMLQDAKAYTDTVKANLLGNGIKDTFDTLVEIQTWIEGDGVNTTELTQAIADEATARTNAINALGSAAYREEVYFVSKAKYDLDMSTKDAQINGLNMEAKRLTNEVIALQERLTALENLIQSQATE